MQRRYLASALIVWGMALTRPVVAQSPTSNEASSGVVVRPEYRLLRDEEDWSYLRTKPASADLWDVLKFIPLTEDAAAYFSIGADIRQQYERTEHELWGTAARDPSGYLLQRYMIHGDAHFGPRLRLFGQLKSGIEVGRDGGPRPTDEDRFDVEQAFLNIQIADRRAGSLQIRIGRQELNFGSARLVSVRDGPNVRQTFDGARAIVASAGWRVDAFVTRPTTTVPGVFDDRLDNARTFLGVYAGKKSPRSSGIDLYYLRLTHDNARYEAGVGNERRHTVGARLWATNSPLDYNVELVWQFGSFGGLPIRAWTVATDTGWHPLLPGRPRFGLRADVTSGDRNRADGTLGTFNPLFPRGFYFGRVDPLGPYNHIDLHPQFDVSLRRGWKLSASWLWFWRTRLDDGVYGIGGQLLFSGLGSNERFVGQSPEIGVERQFSRHLAITVGVGRFTAGPFLQEQHAPRAIEYSTAVVSYRF